MNKIFHWLLKTSTFALPLLFIFACDKDSLKEEDSIDLILEVIDQNSVEEIEYSSERLFKMSSFGVKGFKSSQGMDIYNDSVMFQAGCSGSSTFIHILDLDNHTAFGTIEFTSPDGKASHMNNINCGMKYMDSDLFPLIYLSQTENSRYCYVLRIADNASTYELVQTIRYDGLKFHKGNSKYDWCIDLDNNLIYTYGYSNGNKLNREMVIFPLPGLDKTEVIFRDKDALGNLLINDISIYQGSKITNGILYAPVGAGNGEYPGRLLTVDLKNKAVIRDGTLNCGEPESLGRYKDGVIICGGGGNPYYYFVKP